MDRDDTDIPSLFQGVERVREGGPANAGQVAPRWSRRAGWGGQPKHCIERAVPGAPIGAEPRAPDKTSRRKAAEGGRIASLLLVALFQ
ncbi:uncharacterized protein SOCEGT47_047060 [Sorangium cellulosum]|uniref:Uncharacterized protein n=1 Tax=Sorangium cellulosum TaxID=56 RepID=A0A4P2Q4B8_SORCE|nr:uncharacterized protein SOCEGT47_047060 [Sorangium cellulosum]